MRCRTSCCVQVTNLFSHHIPLLLDIGLVLVERCYVGLGCNVMCPPTMRLELFPNVDRRTFSNATVTIRACVDIFTPIFVAKAHDGMNAHRDPPATYAFVAITAENAHYEQPFKGGELALLDGIVGVEIGPRDVRIMDGSRYHAVAPLRSLPGQNFKSQPLRHSLVSIACEKTLEGEASCALVQLAIGCVCQSPCS